MLPAGMHVALDTAIRHDVEGCGLRWGQQLCNKKVLD